MLEFCFCKNVNMKCFVGLEPVYAVSAQRALNLTDAEATAFFGKTAL